MATPASTSGSRSVAQDTDAPVPERGESNAGASASVGRNNNISVVYLEKLKSLEKTVDGLQKKLEEFKKQQAKETQKRSDLEKLVKDLSDTVDKLEEEGNDSGKLVFILIYTHFICFVIQMLLMSNLLQRNRKLRKRRWMLVSTRRLVDIAVHLHVVFVLQQTLSPRST